MQIPILNGIFADARGEFRTAYPRNCIAVPKAQGISEGYLRPADGIVQLATTPGPDRGGINWQGSCYRVAGTFLIHVSAGGAVTNLGAVGSGLQVSMDYGFGRLAIASSGSLWYFDGSTLVRVTDPDIGNVLDVIWADGYFMTHDGSSIVVTELANPLEVNPLKYGSSEADPDPIKKLLRIRTEVHVVNRHSIEVLDNIGGTGFPFQRIDGAMVRKGAVGIHACCVFDDAIALLGGGRNEPASVWIAINGSASRIATREIDEILGGYTEAQLASAVLESRVQKGHRHLLIHLPDQTLMFDAGATEVMQEPVWQTLTSTVVGRGQYRARNAVWVNDRWIVGDPQSGRVGRLTDSVSTHWGEAIGWDFQTLMIYTEGRGGIVHSLELVGLPGRVAFGADPVIWTSYSHDGETWSQERATRAGKQGERDKRICWRGQGQLRNMRTQRFRGTSDSRMAMARLEAQIEGLDG